MRRIVQLGALWTLLAICFATAFAQSFPSKPIRLIVPWPPGGGTDLLARIYAGRLADTIGQQVVVENRPGAGGIIGSEAVAKAEPDGHTLLWAAGSHTTVAAITPKLPFDPIKSFEPVARVAITPLAIVVTPGLPARNVTELAALAKAKKGELNYGSAGNGSINHLAGELFNLNAGGGLVHVGYKGLGPAIVDLLGGRVHAMFASMPSVMSHVKQDKLRAIGVMGERRSALLPEVPTLAEGGYAGLDLYVWWGVLAPAGTPANAIAKLNADTQRVLATAEMTTRLAAEGAEPTPGTAEAFGEFMARDLARWRTLVRDANIRVE